MWAFVMYLHVGASKVAPSGRRWRFGSFLLPSVGLLIHAWGHKELHDTCAHICIYICAHASRKTQGKEQNRDTGTQANAESDEKQP